MALTMTATATSSTTVRATFSFPVNPLNLTNVGAWGVSPSLTVTGATLNDPTEVDYVDLTTGIQLGGQTYTLTLSFTPEAAVAFWKVKNVSAAYVIDNAGAGTDTPRAYIDVDTSGGTRQVTLPLGSTLNDGDEVAVRRNGANTVTIVRAGAPDTVQEATATLTLTTDKDVYHLVWDATDSNWMLT